MYIGKHNLNKMEFMDLGRLAMEMLTFFRRLMIASFLATTTLFYSQ